MLMGPGVSELEDIVHCTMYYCTYVQHCVHIYCMYDSMKFMNYVFCVKVWVWLFAQMKLRISLVKC